MTPQNIVNMAKLWGYGAIALTDHNSALNCVALSRAAQRIGITFIPGMELCTAEEVHIVCLFRSTEASLDFSHYVKSTLFPIKNKPSVFGEQLICDEFDNITEKEENLLITASNIQTHQAVETVKKYDGICFPAHIDRSSFSILSNLGTIDESFGFKFAEITDSARIPELTKNQPHLNKLTILSNSDAHCLEQMRRPQEFIEVAENSSEAVFEYLKSL